MSNGVVHTYPVYVLARFNRDGTLDRTFGGDGKFHDCFDLEEYPGKVAKGEINGLALIDSGDHQGKIVVAGWTEVPAGGHRFALVRFLPDGLRDNSFGDFGVVLTDFTSSQSEEAKAMAIAVDSRDRIVVGGWVYQQNYPVRKTLFALARYLPDGRPDPDFGGGDGKTVTGFSSAPEETNILRAIVIDDDDNIVVAGNRGTKDAEFLLARYDTRGSLDPNFRGGGWVTTRFMESERAVAKDLAIDPGGKIVAAGWADVDGRRQFAIARYNLDGSSLDPTFGDDGKVLTSFHTANTPEGGEAGATAVAIDPDGKIVAAGWAKKPYDPYAQKSWNFAAIVRYNQDGSPDTVFGQNYDGIRTLDFMGRSLAFRELDFQDSGIEALAIDQRGFIVVTGWLAVIHRLYGDKGSMFVVARLSPDGSLDPTFDDDGKAHTSIPSYDHDRAKAMAIDLNGKIVVAGNNWRPDT